MLIPSIDLQNGAVVQLVQGERLAIKDDDIFKWVRKFERFPKVQVIDLDAAMECYANDLLADLTFRVELHLENEIETETQR